MNPLRHIIHLDLDAFYCAVEEQRDPALKGKAFAVGGRPDQRGVVSSCSYAARARGVRSAMPMRSALNLCPDLRIVSPHFTDYRTASRKVMQILRDLTPLLEQISIDEAFLDVTDLPGSIPEIACGLQAGIRQNVGLPCSLGIASNKLVAKIATDVGKMGAPKGISPNAITIVPPGDEAEFLAPLPVTMLWGVGPKTAEKLIPLGVTTIGELAAHPEVDLLHRFGKNGYDLALRAKGIDNRPIVIEHEAKSISQEVTYVQDVRDPQKLHQTLGQQSAQVARQLQKQNLTARTIKIKLRWSDFTTLTRQVTPGQPFDDEGTIGHHAVDLFEKEWQQAERQPVRLIGVGVSGLEKPPQQIGLWDLDWQKDEKLRQTITALRDRFGEQALQRGIGNKK
ncbi:MAG TPA: DNA polymerase IV [Chloroflexi bacterium]|nr:DNA polymerase IV [Chloroflexota bacterium]